MKHSVVFSILGLSLLPVFPAVAAPKLKLGACSDPALPKESRCGTYEVFENRAARKGRKIPLRVVVLRALGKDRLPDPVVYFAGGPGEASVDEGIYVAQELAPLRQRRDFLLVDPRGTGGSGPSTARSSTAPRRGSRDSWITSCPPTRCGPAMTG